MRPYDGTEKYIFISYAHKDSQRVLPLIEGLAQAGLRVWFDEGIEAGAEWPAYVEKRLRACHRMIYFVTEASVESKNCRREVNLVDYLNKDVLVVFLERTELKYGMELQLSSSQSIFRDKFADDADFLRAITEAKILSECRGMAKSAADQAAPAPKPVSASAPAPAPTAVSEKQVNEWSAEGDRLYGQKRYDEAVGYYRRAAEQGHAWAQFRLGLCYENGRGITKDATQAVTWYRKAAEQGHAPAQSNLGYCYGTGTGVAKDATQAVYWYRKAAEQGLAPAQYNLGWCYQHGRGVTADKVQAIAWYRKAAEQGDADAKKKLEELT